MTRSGRALIKWVIPVLGIVIGLSVIAYYAFPVAAARLGSWLAIEARNLPPGAQVDAVVVLGGNTLERMVVGVDLYKASVAPLVALTGYEPDDRFPEFNDSLFARNYALTQGVPEQNLTLLKTTSTLEDAEQVTAYVRQYGLRGIVVVSNWSHGRRAICTLTAHMGPDAPTIYFAPSSTKYSPSNWWMSESGLVDTVSEAAKIGVYTFIHGISMWGCFPGDPNLLAYLILSILSLTVSLVGVEWVRRNARRLNRIDIPNERSSHSIATPRGGGMGIVVSVVGVWLLFLLTSSHQSGFPPGIQIGFLLTATLVAGVGWLDDRHSLPVRPRLLLYVIIGVSFIGAVGVIDSLDLPGIGSTILSQPLAIVLTLLWLIGFLNIFNFMDGIDGLAGSQACIAAVFWLIVLLIEGQAELAMLSCLIAAACLGFLFHNLPPARIFMGDVGSAFLGFALAALPLMAYVQTGNARLPVVGGLFVAPFILDGSLTILQRAMKRENVLTAHRSHLYQRLVIAGLSHAQVGKEYRWLMFLGCVCGIAYYAGSNGTMLLSLVVMLATFVAYELLGTKRIMMYQKAST